MRDEGSVRHDRGSFEVTSGERGPEGTETPRKDKQCPLRFRKDYFYFQREPEKVKRTKRTGQ